MDILFFDKRPMLLIGLMILVGVYIGTGNSPIWAVILAALLAIGAFIGKTKLLYIITALLCGTIFFVYTCITENIYDESYSKFNNKNCRVVGKVYSVDAIKEKYTLVTIKPNGFNKKMVKVYFMHSKADMIQGDRVEFTGKLSKPEAAENPGGYDARKVLYSDGITASIFADAENLTINRRFSASQILGLIRRDIKDTCNLLLEKDRGSILAGMLIGDRTGLDSSVTTSFRESGLSHTMAVSGAHVAYILVPLMFVFSKMGIERRKYYLWLLAALGFFALLTGFTPSVARASLTAGMMLLGGIIHRETDALNNIAISAVILIIINPFAIYDVGFILSYICVLAIFIFYKPLLKVTGRSPVAKILALTVAVQIGILPATVKLFYSVQIFSVIANLLIFPVRALLAVTGWVMYLMSNLFMPAARLLAPVTGILTDSVSQVAELFGNTPFSTVNVPYIPVWLIIVYAVSVYLALHLPTKKLITLFSGLAVIIIYMRFFSIPTDTYVFFDSGQADCFLVKTHRGGDVLIDTGRYALGNPIAHFCGDYIDFIFITHAHKDHIGGLEAILKRFKVGMVFIPGCGGSNMEGVVNMCRTYKVSCRKLIAGSRLKVDGYEINILNPVNKNYLALNDTSLVLKLSSSSGVSLLYCGDIEIPAEIDILTEGRDIKADIFKVPHHGASGSAYNRFFDAVSPRISVISCGENYYGHPSYESIELLHGSDLYRTDRDGAVIIKVGNRGFKVETCKDQTTVN